MKNAIRGNKSLIHQPVQCHDTVWTIRFTTAIVKNGERSVKTFLDDM
jgi:hypothetical protein